jgi:hypothetical protein
VAVAPAHGTTEGGRGVGAIGRFLLSLPEPANVIATTLLPLVPIAGFVGFFWAYARHRRRAATLFAIVFALGLVVMWSTLEAMS